MAGIDAFGTKFSIEDDVTPGTFIDVASVTNIDVLDIDVDDLDVSAHDSPSQWREFLGGMKDGGELSLELNYDPAVHATLLDHVAVTKNFKITLPPDASDAEVAFSGHISGLTAGAPYDDKLTATATVKVSGPVAITLV